MGFLSKVVEVMTGGLGKEIFDTVKEYFPPEMTLEQKLNVELALENAALKRTQQAIEAQQAAEKAINDRIAMYEGTASDLKSVPYLGALLLFARGAQRPVWGFATMYIDYKVFSGVWDLQDPTVASAFWVVNILVLGFLFGERALTNVMPHITELLKVKRS